MFFYAGTVIITTLLAWIYSHAKEKKIKRILYALLVMCLATISGLRGVGTDIRPYIDYANEIVAGTYNLVDYNSIFVQIARTFLKHNVSFQIILFAVSIITIHIIREIICFNFLNKVIITDSKY